MARQNYNDETKAAVMAALLAGQSVSSVAKEYSIPKGTVSGWKDKIYGVAVEATQKKDTDGIGNRLIELIETDIETLVVISKLTRDSDWVRKQSAADLAVFVGVKQDKLIRMLESFGRADSDTGSGN